MTYPKEKLTVTEETGLFLAVARDGDGGTYVAYKWRTTENEARRFFDKFATGADLLVGRSGRILAVRGEAR